MLRPMLASLHTCKWNMLDSCVRAAVQEVRKAVVGALAPDPGATLPAIIDRTHDIEPEGTPDAHSRSGSISIHATGRLMTACTQSRRCPISMLWVLAAP